MKRAQSLLDTSNKRNSDKEGPSKSWSKIAYRKAKKFLFGSHLQDRCVSVEHLGNVDSRSSRLRGISVESLNAPGSSRASRLPSAKGFWGSGTISAAGSSAVLYDDSEVIRSPTPDLGYKIYCLGMKTRDFTEDETESKEDVHGATCSRCSRKSGLNIVRVKFSL